MQYFIGMNDNLPAADAGQRPCEARDPRVDPMVGDILRRSGKTRSIHAVYERHVEYFGQDFIGHRVSLFLYRKWAKIAAVKRRGKELQGERPRPAAGKV